MSNVSHAVMVLVGNKTDLAEERQVGGGVD